jgi:hypothetical protein
MTLKNENEEEMTLKNPRTGDVVYRMLSGDIEMPLIVRAVRDDKVICGSWEFDLVTGAEIDDMLDWGPPPKHTGSFLRFKNGEIEVR